MIVQIIRMYTNILYVTLDDNATRGSKSCPFEFLKSWEKDFVQQNAQGATVHVNAEVIQKLQKKYSCQFCHHANKLKNLRWFDSFNNPLKQNKHATRHAVK